MATYTIKDLSFSYPEQDKKVLQEINLEITQGEFVVLCGLSGCGKTTLLRQLKPILSPHGQRSGSILYDGNDIFSMNQREQSTQIGFVLQSPDNQIVTDKVWHELAFGLESLGLDTPTIRLRVAEMASFFGIQNWFHKKTSELSGGQKQLLNLASIMAMQPEVLILDEPTSQLDPIAAADFLATIGKINRELGTTIILTEHRIEEVLPLTDRLLVMESGKIIADNTPSTVGEYLAKEKHPMFSAMPTPMWIYGAVPNELQCPITIRDGRNWLSDYAKTTELQPVPMKPVPEKQNPLIEMKEAWFRYEADAEDVIRGLDLTIYQGEFLALLGGNGTGKTTILSLLSGLQKPYRGTLQIEGKSATEISDTERFGNLFAVLPQNPQSLFVKKTVELDLWEVMKQKQISSEEAKKTIADVVQLCGLEQVQNQHPYDLSGGEQQRLALAKVLLLDAKILLLDEPTKGMDAAFKKTFAGILQTLLQRGITIVMVSHDIEFCATYAERCAMVFDGKIVTKGTPQGFFSGNGFYTTAANRMSRHLLSNAVTAEDVIVSCGGIVEEVQIPNIPLNIQSKPSQTPEIQMKKSTKKKHWLGICSLILLGLTLLIGGDTGTELASNFHLFGRGEFLDTPYMGRYLLYLGCIVLSVVGLFVNFMDMPAKSTYEQMPVEKRILSKRTKVAMAMILLLIPLTIYVGTYFFGSRKYYFIALLIILETMLPFVLIFEDRKPQARELVVIAVLCAIGVAGRSAFFMLPQFKPVVALVILSGIAFGGEVGFLVGAITAFASNMFFGQGPWTPWQMFAFGIIGFLAGILFRKGWISRNPLSLAIFGGVATFVIYGGIIDAGSYFMYQSVWNPDVFFASLLMGIPFNMLHAVSTIFFLMVLSEPMLENLDRIKVKYGLLE
ncbi:ECF transporter S component [Chakrabartyella piscis]|uniref:ECF transporter S component n=1 Tax=Chakrabartyella piscis TaxID=2918914 RepID=UPI002958C8EC|nr:ECF transporter S component [Chakrabartyella piscis]